MSNKKLFDELHQFFLKVNKARTDVMRKENPNDRYDYFPKDEQPELVIRKGMNQYEDLVKKFKRMERKGGIKLTKEPETSQSSKESSQSQTTNIKTTKAKKQEKTEKEKPSPKKRKTSGTKEEEKEKPSPKKRKTSGVKEEEKEKPSPKKRKTSGAKEEDKEKTSPKKRKTSGTKEDESKDKPQIIKRTVGTDNPITKVKKEKDNENKEKENEKEKEKVIEEKKETSEKKPKKEEKPKEEKKIEKEEAKKEKEEKEEEEEENEEQEDIGEDDDNFVTEPEEGYINSQMESTEYEITPEIKIKAKWYYIDKKKPENEEEIEEDDDPEKEEKVHIKISTTAKNALILHWGIYKAMSGLTWHKPPKESFPPETKEIDKMSVETEFPKKGDRSIKILLPRGKGYKDYIGGINFVIFDPASNTWYNNYRKDYQIKFKLKVDKTKSRAILIQKGLYVPDFMFDVINCEANYGSWTLMHRYNKCSDIIKDWDLKVDNDKWVWILIWLRYSFLRQLDWQRNYNTRPVLLSGAMAHLSDLLTGKYGDALKNEKEYRNLIDSKSSIIKNVLALLGKGTGNGQQIRDEILKVMSRNKIPKTH